MNHERTLQLERIDVIDDLISRLKTPLPFIPNIDVLRDFLKNAIDNVESGGEQLLAVFLQVEVANDLAKSD